MSQLAPFEPALGPQPANSRLYSPDAVTLQLKGSVFSLRSGTFAVTTAEGSEVCKINASIASPLAKKQFLSLEGQELFTLKKNVLNLTGFAHTFNGKSPNGHDFEVKGRFKLNGTKSTVKFKNASDGQQVELQINGKWLNRSADITLDGRPVASISRNVVNVRAVVSDNQTYFVTVAPNVDLSLIIAICVSLDAKEDDDWI